MKFLAILSVVLICFGVCSAVPADYVVGQTGFTTNAAGSGLASFSSPQRPALGPTGKLFVVDTVNHRVTRFGSTAISVCGANAEYVFGGVSGLTSSQFRLPSSIATDGLDNLWVNDQLNVRVVRFASASTVTGSPANANLVLGQISFTTTGNGAGLAQFTAPNAIAVGHDNNLIVSDNPTSRVTIFKNTDTIANGAAASVALGKSFMTCARDSFLSTNDVYVDNLNRLWVSDFRSYRVLRWDNVTSVVSYQDADFVLGQPSFTTCSAPGNSNIQMALLSGLTIDEDNDILYVSNENRIVGYYHASSMSGFLTPMSFVIGQSDFSTVDEFAPPTDSTCANPGKMFSRNGKLLVACRSDNRVLVFNSPPSALPSSPSSSPSV